MKTKKIFEKDEEIMIPVSFGIFRKNETQRHTTGFVNAKFIEYLDFDKASIRYGTDVFTIGLTQII